MRKTKIVATLGPATDAPGILEAMIDAGLDVARFNFSHSVYDQHTARLNQLRDACNAKNATVAFLADNKGPEVRLGTFENGGTELLAGDTFTLTTDYTVIGNGARAGISYPGLPSDVKKGTRILLDDGLIELEVESISGMNIKCRVVSGGKISDRKSVNVPDTNLAIPYISSQDRLDLRFIIENDFDILAASFVRNANDINDLREEIARIDSKNKMKIIAKIENEEGVTNVDSILAVCDGLMIARGDLGVEVEFEELPIIQKDLIKRAISQGKPVITATQMLESMINNPRPTRAEASDVANAIYDGTSAIMLSGETAVGKYPLETFQTMDSIARRIEASIDYRQRFFKGGFSALTSITNAISHATVTTSHDLNAAAILAVSLSGNTAQNVSKYRPTSPIIACTPDIKAMRQLKLNWGIIPVLTKEETETNALFSHAVDAAIEAGHIKQGDLVVLTAGVPVGLSGTTNLMKIHVAGDKMLV